MRHLLFFFLLLAPMMGWAQPRFGIPIGGFYLSDWKIINYVDWATDTSIRDNHCRTKTYDGHQGTDFCIRNFRQMDSGVAVYAADAGRVIFVQDGLFDRNKVSVVSRGLGNYVGIRHSGKLFTYYGHLRKNSILVKAGDSVSAGQQLGLVGSSGNSTDPHLHFELWYDSSIYIDPFSGPCGNAGSYWLHEPAYDSSFGVWTSGMCNYRATLDTLREEPVRRDTFLLRDPYITFWSELYGLRSQDSLSSEWYTPQGILWSRFGIRNPKDAWLYYYWDEIVPQASMPEGRWSVRLLRNSQMVQQASFYFFKTPASVSAGAAPAQPWWVVYNGRALVLQGLGAGDVWRLCDATGRVWKQGIWEAGQESHIPIAVPHGLYIFTLLSRQGVQRAQKLVL